MIVTSLIELTFMTFQSDVPLDLQEVDKSSAVVSYTPPDTEVTTPTLAQVH